MKLSVERFYRTVPDGESISNRERIEFFAYFLEAEQGLPSFTSKQIETCFDECALRKPSNVPQTLSRGTSERPPLYIKAPSGYRLERHFRDSLAKRLGNETHTINVATELRQLEDKLDDGPGKQWFGEALDCFGVEAYRASMMLGWIFTLDHLFNYIIRSALPSFNAALQAHPDQKTVKKVGSVSERDHFTLLGEEIFIELCKSAKIISPDVRKILIEKLGTRNSIAHPSGIRVSRTKAVEFIEDLVTNVVLKYR